jgi:hypothetical protein
LRDLPADQAMPRREAVVAALNGVVGDHLERTANPLAFQFELRLHGELPGSAETPVSGARLLRGGHDHGEALARALGYVPIYARYNSGRHISADGLRQTLASQGCCSSGSPAGR